MSIESFFTRQKGSEGRKLSLVLPDGSPSDDYIVIRSIDSEEYQSAARKLEKALIRANIAGEENSEAVETELALDLNVSLVKDWSFDEPVTPENVRRLLVEAPQIAKAIEARAHDRAFFYRSSPSSSSSTSSSKSKARKK